MAIPALVRKTRSGQMAVKNTRIEPLQPPRSQMDNADGCISFGNHCYFVDANGKIKIFMIFRQNTWVNEQE
jgi:hypothetical protein